MEEQKIHKQNFKSDFDFPAVMKCYGKGGIVEIGFADYDWELTLYTDCNHVASRGYIVSYIGGKCTNCVNDGGKVRVIMNDHKLNVGELRGTIKAQIPNSLYPDGHQLIVENYVFPIELVADGGDAPTEVEVEILLPYLYDSAYRQAVVGGYKGTQEEYYALATQLPSAVETAMKIQGTADSLAESAEQIGGAIETLGATTDAIEQGASVIKDNADVLQASADIVKTSAEQIGGNIKALQESVGEIDGIRGSLETTTIAVTNSATKVENSATTLANASTSLNNSASSLSASATAIAEGATTIKNSTDALQTNADKVGASATSLENSVSAIETAIANAVRYVLNTNV